MTENTRFEKICKEFCLLSEEKQEYILGMLQALVYVHDESGRVSDELGQVLEPAYNPRKEACNEQ
jgi:hypothetical protein